MAAPIQSDSPRLGWPWFEPLPPPPPPPPLLTPPSTPETGLGLSNCRTTVLHSAKTPRALLEATPLHAAASCDAMPPDSTRDRNYCYMVTRIVHILLSSICERHCQKIIVLHLLCTFSSKRRGAAECGVNLGHLARENDALSMKQTLIDMI